GCHGSKRTRKLCRAQQVIGMTRRLEGHDPPADPEPVKPRRPRSNEPKPFEGLTQKPHCALCERDAASPKVPPPVPPDPMPPTNRRPREIDTSLHFCPHAG